MFKVGIKACEHFPCPQRSSSFPGSSLFLPRDWTQNKYLTIEITLHEINASFYLKVELMLTLIFMSLIKLCVNFRDLNFHLHYIRLKFSIHSRKKKSIVLSCSSSASIMDTVKNVRRSETPLLNPYVLGQFHQHCLYFGLFSTEQILLLCSLCKSR